MKVSVVRPTNLYGPWDHFDPAISHVIPALIKRALKKDEPYIVWGNESLVRDFIFMDDLTEGVLRVLNNYCYADPINISNGKPTTIGELVNVILKVCDHQATVKYDSTKPTAIPYRVLNNTKSDKLLGKINKTSLEEGIRKTVEWYNSSYARD